MKYRHVVGIVWLVFIVSVLLAGVAVQFTTVALAGSFVVLALAAFFAGFILLADDDTQKKLTAMLKD
jgi:uncharacterized membrane protein